MAETEPTAELDARFGAAHAVPTPWPEVVPTTIQAFAKGDFAQTRYRF